MIRSEAVLGLPEYEITAVEETAGMVRISVRFTGSVCCPHCRGSLLRRKDRRLRRLRHESWGTRQTTLHLQTVKWRCLGCLRYFWQRFAGILPRQRASERFHRSVCEKHFDGTSRSRLARRERISSATIERWFTSYLSRLALEKTSTEFPQVLGIDEHFFSRSKGYAKTFCDLKNHKVYDVVLGRSELSLEGYLGKLKGKDRVRVVCVDLSTSYRALVQSTSRRPLSSLIASMSYGLSTTISGLLETDRSGGIEESRSAVTDAPASPQAEPGSAYAVVALLDGAPGDGDHLPVQTATLLPAAGEAQDQTEVSPAGEQTASFDRRVAAVCDRLACSTRGYAAQLARGNCGDVALHQE